jgi:adiponectin receptor
MVVDSLQYIPEIIGNADLNKIREELLKCLASLPDMPDLHKVKNELSTSLHSLNFSPLSGRNVMELLINCFPEHFSSVRSHPILGFVWLNNLIKRL